MDGEIFQRIAQLADGYVPAAPWDFLTATTQVRCLPENSDQLFVALSEQFTSEQLQAARVLLCSSQHEQRPSSVLIGDQRPFLIWKRDQDPYPFDIVNNSGSLRWEDPPAFHANYDAFIRAASEHAREILATYSDADLAILSLIGMPCAPAAGLERMNCRRIRRLFDQRSEMVQGAMPDDQLAPVRREDYAITVANWNIAALRLEESPIIRELASHIDNIEDAVGRFTIDTSCLRVWTPSPTEMQSIRAAVSLRDLELVQRLMCRSLYFSTRTVSGFSASTRAQQSSSDYREARQALHRGIDSDQPVGRAELARLRASLDESHAHQVVEGIVRDAMAAPDAMDRSLLLGAAELMQDFHRSTNVVQAAEAACLGRDHSSDNFDPDVLTKKLRIVDSIVKIHRELSREK